MGSAGPAPLATLNSGGLAVPHRVVVRSKRDAWLMCSLKNHPERQAYDQDSSACFPGGTEKSDRVAAGVHTVGRPHLRRWHQTMPPKMDAKSGGRTLQALENPYNGPEVGLAVASRRRSGGRWSREREGQSSRRGGQGERRPIVQGLGKAHAAPMPGTIGVLGSSIPGVGEAAGGFAQESRGSEPGAGSDVCELDSWCELPRLACQCLQAPVSLS